MNDKLNDVEDRQWQQTRTVNNVRSGYSMWWNGRQTISSQRQEQDDRLIHNIEK